MKHVLKLAWRYLAYQRARTLILVACIALTFLLPLALNVLVHRYGTSLAARAEATPLVVGAPGSRYDLVLNSLYFRGRVPRRLAQAEADKIFESGLALPIPLLLGHTAGGLSIVGCGFDYYAFRGLEPERGELPLELGDAVLGARAARELGLGPGDGLLSDQGSLYDLTLSYPLKMKVVGVLAESGTPDDDAVFVDVATTWVIEGIGHGHTDAADAGADTVLARNDKQVVFNAAVVEYAEITPDNVDSFHFHAEPEELPLTAVLVVPHDAKGATLLKGRYRVSETAQMLVPAVVIDEVLGLVFKIKVFFDANLVLVSTATLLFLVLIVLLTLRVRQREMETLFKLGCARRTVAKLIGTELAIVLLLGFAAAGILAWLLVAALGRGGPFP